MLDGWRQKKLVNSFVGFTKEEEEKLSHPCSF